MATHAPRRRRIPVVPDIALEPGEQLVRLTWPAGPRRLRPRSRWATLRESQQRYSMRFDVRYVYRYHDRSNPNRPWNRYTPGNKWQLDRQLQNGDILVERVWQPPYAVSSGL